MSIVLISGRCSISKGGTISDRSPTGSYSKCATYGPHEASSSPSPPSRRQQAKPSDLGEASGRWRTSFWEKKQRVWSLWGEWPQHSDEVFTNSL